MAIDRTRSSTMKRRVLQTFHNPFQLGGRPPVLLSREIHNPLRAIRFAGRRDEHLTDANLLVLTGDSIVREVLLEALLEHERNSFAHDTDRIHGVHQSPRV